MYELIIIGAGPAGITASIYAARKRLNLLTITDDIGGQAALSSSIENYTGYQYIKGSELAMKFEEHVREFNVEVKYEEVIKVERIQGGFGVRTSDDYYESKALIIASGSRPRTLNVPGEREFKNRGVTYCATCDAPLFAGKDVAVVGGGNSALDATLQLLRIARKIYLVQDLPSLTGDSAMCEKVKKAEKVTVLTSTKVLDILGNAFVNGITVEKEGRREALGVQGVFVEIGYVPSVDFATGLVEVNMKREIIVDEYCRTSVDGIFAAGDVTDVPQKQIIVAAGEGAKAALSAYEYIQKLV